MDLIRNTRLAERIFGGTVFDYVEKANSAPTFPMVSVAFEQKPLAIS